ncbi:uncharacterized protein P174DRAFT_74690 [Aspergillus novofumigatus IBT 16806]|uniref:Uncharacterized protein n=1 Tax=Aspergillus novofumigatus (strain IBT 16806) TaxID=1392255 RepID=A0A2I1BSH5_ASPN1|nr:uncharacterized protein P174DRAFT_74690 [Aspergillus novofumigatus IBT 16806]PKX88345.1 hypothetical protein P174DRAFT_74690 [Aspergillus novofumigatus IBT 16806]
MQMLPYDSQLLPSLANSRKTVIVPFTAIVLIFFSVSKNAASSVLEAPGCRRSKVQVTYSSPSAPLLTRLVIVILPGWTKITQEGSFAVPVSRTLRLSSQ